MGERLDEKIGIELIGDVEQKIVGTELRGRVWVVLQCDINPECPILWLFVGLAIVVAQV